MIVHLFDSTGEAYLASKHNEEIRTGHILLIPSEQVVALAHTQPIAVTKCFGKLRTHAATTVANFVVAHKPFTYRQVADAQRLAKSLGYELR